MISDLGFIFLLSLVAGAFSWWMTGVARAYALRNDVLDHPSDRSSHSVATPRGGGIAIVVVFLTSMTAMWFFNGLDSKFFSALLIGGLMVAAVGYWDDHQPLRASTRMLIHSVAALVSLTILQIWSLEFPWNTWIPGWLNLPLGVLAVIWLVNLFNFMDGIDGLAGSEAINVAIVIAGIAAFFGNREITLLMTLLAASTAGFLIWNWAPAKIFLGDIGSGFLGFQFAVLAVGSAQQTEIPIWVWGILLGVFLIDATFTLMRRMLTGQVWYQAHRSHAYQIASRQWSSHQTVVWWVLAINFLWLLPLAIIAIIYPEKGFLLMMIAIMPLILVCYKFKAGDKLA